MKRWSELVRKESWDEECEICKMPVMLHKGPCTRIQGEANAFEFGKLWEAWSLFKEKMKPIRKWQADEEAKIKIQSDTLVGMNKIVESQDKDMAVMIESIFTNLFKYYISIWWLTPQPPLGYKQYKQKTFNPHTS